MWLKLLIALGLAPPPRPPRPRNRSTPRPRSAADLVPLDPIYRIHTLAAADMRDRLDLSGAWRWSIDPYRDGVAGFHGDPAGYGHRRWEDVDVAQVEARQSQRLVRI